MSPSWIPRETLYFQKSDVHSKLGLSFLILILRKLWFSLQTKVKIWAPQYYKLQIVPDMELGLGHILLKSGSWDGEESGLNKDVMAVVTMNVPESNILRESG